MAKLIPEHPHPAVIHAPSSRGADGNRSTR